VIIDRPETFLHLAETELACSVLERGLDVVY
jgi:hypothetical protein